MAAPFYAIVIWRQHIGIWCHQSYVQHREAGAGHISRSLVIPAVDARPADREHQQLNARILETANLVAGLSKSPLHLVSAYPSPMQDAAPKDQVPALLAREYRNTCQALAAPYGVGSQQIHVAAGPAEHLLPEIADQLDARLMILGTVARSGLQGTLLGNTAEQILARINTDVLVLPPPSTD